MTIRGCPFCGENLATVCRTAYLDTETFAVSCRTRDCHGAIFSLGYGLFETEAEAVAGWNTRAMDADLLAAAQILAGLEHSDKGRSFPTADNCAFARAAIARALSGVGYCSDCPPLDYPTDETRCEACPRRAVTTRFAPADTTESVSITQADRNAAADLIEAFWNISSGRNRSPMREVAADMRSGECGGLWEDAFARHRLAERERCAAVAETRPTMDPNMPREVLGLQETYITVGCIVGRKIAAAIRGDSA